MVEEHAQSLLQSKALGGAADSPLALIDGRVESLTLATQGAAGLPPPDDTDGGAVEGGAAAALVATLTLSLVLILIIAACRLRMRKAIQQQRQATDHELDMLRPDGASCESLDESDIAPSRA